MGGGVGGGGGAFMVEGFRGLGFRVQSLGFRSLGVWG